MLRWKIGDVRVTRVLESCSPLPPEGLIPRAAGGAIAKHAGWLAPHFLTPQGQILLAVQALVIESRGQTIVVDTCMGNDRPLPMGLPALQTSFLRDLEREVCARERVDRVVCTHLHFDHVGWNTMLVDGRWQPTFPNARYLFGRAEYAHWQQGGETNGARETIEPVVLAGLHDLVESDHELTDEVWLEPTPGHTPGHVSVRISSRGEEAVITGDMVHHPVQLAEPDWGSSPDSDPAQAARTRRDFASRHGNRNVLVIGTHFADPVAGKIVRDGDAWRFVA
jgi:glyoxylase-like metal-dependent hydrolase (beta-lactamase superfamily II)